MRISADPASPDYYAAKAPGARVLFDGIEIDRCRLADEERGYVIVTLVDGVGRVVLEGEEIATQLRYGEVKIVLRERPA
ncbi:hypothetical protein [Xanthobacter aminoxidans]|uniref:hypothetical protein n=1 Tax=Xanthobacter aminoxidans TaxID=186280 RepID=UPI0020230C6F|nr:hypothetical protein [Xanthobacter aminoxidans]MCL8382060.1 hypothetical protein [Xanthobacter aminoxidans]